MLASGITETMKRNGLLAETRGGDLNTAINLEYFHFGNIANKTERREYNKTV
jgi:hypothetical protein